LHAIAGKAREMGPGFYLDLPLGVNPDSYDVWREKDAFANGVAAGAPPDPFFATGQNWGFAPLHPERIRTQGYRYVTSYVRHHLGLAGILRIDHMMGLHRLFWIPKGMEARDGIYVKYNSEEFYAVFTLESHRHKSMLVGEDLGTVPPEVPPAMARHNVHRMYVLQYSLQPWADNAMQPVFEGCVASANTHDMPPFAAFWRGLDIEDRIDLGILTRDSAGEEHRQRQALLGSLVQYLRNQGRLGHEFNELDVLRACLLHMCSGQAFVVLATLEDLWGETLPQNVPGTWKERNNWRRKAAHSLEAIRQMPHAVDTLRAMDHQLRSRGR
jgi:4-alpha-glucanotransferase